jgi:NAD(P)-dependent dehydrogenase (short-subunit alcohol dehydrogenase family)
VSGLFVPPRLGRSAYNASKAALNVLTLHMAHEFQEFGVRVNACAPNTFPQVVATDDVARSLRNLAEGRINGKILVIDKQGEHFVDGPIPALPRTPVSRK